MHKDHQMYFIFEEISVWAHILLPPFRPPPLLAHALALNSFQNFPSQVRANDLIIFKTPINTNFFLLSFSFFVEFSEDVTIHFMDVNYFLLLT